MADFRALHGTKATISQISRRCAKLFRLLEIALSNSQPDLPISFTEVKDETQRFNQWLGISGAWQTPERIDSLDQRLQESKMVVKLITETLETLEATLESAIEIMSGNRQNRSMSPEDPAYDAADDDSANLSLSESDIGDGAIVLHNVSDAIGEHRTEIEELFLDIQGRNDALFRSLIFVQQFAVTTDRDRASTSTPFTSTADTQYILDRFQKVAHRAPGLALRMGEANAHRRQYFKYCRDHLDRKEHTLEVQEDEIGDARKAEKPRIDHAVAKSQVTKHTLPSNAAETDFTGFGLISDVPNTFDPPVEVASSIRSKATSIAQKDTNELAFPPMPLGLQEGRSAICDLCQRPLVLKQGGKAEKEKQWQKHVLTDLQPYVCTFNSCSISSFSSQHEWWEHEMTLHRAVYFCRSCNSDSFDSSADLETHLVNEHASQVTESQRPLVIEQSRRPADLIATSACPFCNNDWARPENTTAIGDIEVMVTPSEFRRHLGFHMIQIAVFALPRAAAIGDEVSDMKAQVSQNEGRSELSNVVVRPQFGRGWAIVRSQRLVLLSLAVLLGMCEKSKVRSPVESVMVGTAQYKENFLEVDQEPDYNHGETITSDGNDHASLRRAVQTGNEAMVKLLLENGADLESKDEYGQTPLSWAAKNGHEAVVRFLVEKGSAVDSQDTRYGRTPLLWAAKNGHEAVVRLLVEKGAAADSQDTRYRKTPLSWAAENGHEAVVKLLVEKGAAVDSRDTGYGQIPLSWAAENGYEAVVRLLVEKGAAVDSRDTGYGRTPLLWAAENGHEAVVKLLVEKGAAVDSVDNDGQTPLSLAVQNGNEEVVKLLIEKGAAVDSRDTKYDQTPLSSAAQNGQETVVKLLVEKGALVDSVDKYGQTPLSWAAKNGHEAVVKLLIDKSAAVDSVDVYGRTPLSWAAENGHEGVVKLLVEEGAAVDMVDTEHGQTALSCAAEKGHEGVVKLLVENGAAVDWVDNYGQTPLSCAAERGKSEVVKLLVDKGATVDSIDNYGQSPLLWAAKNGREGAVKLLIENGAAVDSVDKYGRTPLLWAAEKGRKAVVKLLIENGAAVDLVDNHGGTPLSQAAENGYDAVVELLKSKNP